MKARVLFGRIRRSGVRIHSGPWTASGVTDTPGQLIVALGRTAGPAVVRSRVRRIAREVFRKGRREVARNTSVLIMARASITTEPRRRIRTMLGSLLARLDRAIEKQTQGGSGVSR